MHFPRTATWYWIKLFWWGKFFPIKIYRVGSYTTRPAFGNPESVSITALNGDVESSAVTQNKQVQTCVAYLTLLLPSGDDGSCLATFSVCHLSFWIWKGQVGHNILDPQYSGIFLLGSVDSWQAGERRPNRSSNHQICIRTKIYLIKIINIYISRWI